MPPRVQVLCQTLARSRSSEGLAEVLLVKTLDPVIVFPPVLPLDQQELVSGHSLR
jgi:hypothetical protein